MADPLASPADVRIEYENDLEAEEINDYIARANREVERYNDLAAFDVDDDRRDLEAALAAYYIATRSRDRAVESKSSGRTGVDFEAEVVGKLEARVESLDPSGELPREGMQQADFEVF